MVCVLHVYLGNADSPIWSSGRPAGQPTTSRKHKHFNVDAAAAGRGRTDGRTVVLACLLAPL